ncbi:formimidoylglutamase [Ralstonia pickettii]|uniref:formimidoylglutamase n=1 Tax=Ralstonia pickettii TaxID=329 RepID=UPI00046A77B2|nr:formimidoylglutamase [Ralstonia pickettii]
MRTMFDASVWQGRDDTGERGDVTRLFQVVLSHDATTLSGVPALLGFACDAGVVRNHGRAGAALGPREIRRALANVPAHGLSVLADAGDVTCDDGDLEGAQATLGETVCELLDAGARPVVLGGGHEVAFGTYKGLRQHWQKQGWCGRLAVVNFDAHFDLRTSRPGNSGTPFDQIAEDCAAHGIDLTYCCLGVSRLSNTPALFDRADALHAHYVEDTVMQERHLDARTADLDAWLADADHVYLTIDMDVLAAAVAPGVSAPAAYGITLPMLEALVQHVCATGKVRVADIAETNPEYDQDRRTVRVAARLAYHLLRSP